MLTRNRFNSFGCCLSALLLISVPAFAQTVEIRLFEIFHPRSVEISAERPQLEADGYLPKTHRDQTAAVNLLRVAVANHTLFETNQPIQITLTKSALLIQSAGFNRSLGLIDTVTISAANLLFAVPAALPHNNNATLRFRPYSGLLKINVVGHELCIVNVAPIEDYLAGILAAEMPQADLSALQAQAVVSRTYLVKNGKRHQTGGYQFCDLTHCQTYKGVGGVTSTIRQAVTSTRNEILTFVNQPIEAYYSSTCGGLTADDADLWGTAVDLPYLNSISDSLNHLRLCADSPHFRWRFRVRADSLHQLWQQRLGEPITSITVTKSGKDGRVRELALMGNTLHLLSGEDFRTVVCRAFGWNTIKSTAFELQVVKNNYIFAGSGLGHGLGLCQYGAMAMAQQGYSYREILRHYFPGTEIEKSLENREH